VIGREEDKKGMKRGRENKALSYHMKHMKVKQG
jgi:hypothetical protein